jgi:hypothetical protein
MPRLNWTQTPLLMAVTTSTYGQVPSLDDGPGDPPPVRVSAYSENDGVYKLAGATDRHYTNGFGLGLTWRSDTAKQWLDAALPASDGAAFGLALVHKIHTPDVIDINPPDPEDRPYAGYLYGSAVVQRQVNDGRRAHYDALRLDLGVVGPSAQAEAVQTAVHDTFFGDNPEGWDAQLGDEFAFQVQYQRKLRLDAGRFDLGGARLDGQLIPQFELEVGTVRRTVGGSLLYRLGFGLPDDFGPDQLRDIQSLTGDPFPAARNDHPLGPGFRSRGGVWSGYGFGRIGGHYAEWDTFLDGNYARDPSPSVERRPWVGKLEAGLAVGWSRGPHSVEANYSVTWLTDEFEGQAGHNSFAALNLRWVVSF